MVQMRPCSLHKLTPIGWARIPILYWYSILVIEAIIAMLLGVSACAGLKSVPLAEARACAAELAAYYVGTATEGSSWYLHSCIESMAS